MKGVGNGVKLGVQEIMTHFNPIAPIVSDAYYHANVRDNMSDQEKAALRSKGDLIGECVGAAASLAYIGAACKYPNISGTNAFAKAGSSATQLLLQKVATGLMALGNAGQMVIAALLCDILRKASATQEDVATLRAESTKMQYAIDTMADTRRKISDESAQNAADLFGMLNMLMAASKKCFVIR
jgi:(p)ppGpp synthase/HD superfamily hydrolase